MRILFASQLLPFPLDAGPKIRAYYVLRHLARAGHEITLVCRVRPGDRDQDVRALGRLCRSVVTLPLARSRLADVRDGLMSLMTGEPFLVRRDQSREVDDCLAQATRGRTFDALHADQLWMASTVAHNADVGFKVLDQHNAVFKVPERLAKGSANLVTRHLLRAEARKLEEFERDIVQRFTRVVWVSRQDRDAVCNGTGGREGRDTVIPISVDPGGTPPLCRVRPFRVTFLGGLHWPPNREGMRWFATSVWPRVARAVPGAVLTVIGKGAAGSPVSSERVEWTGYVADPTRYLKETAVFVVPLLSGAGMRVKILDAWCRAVPVVSTSMGAEGLDARDRENILIADGEEAFSESVVDVFRDRKLAHRLALGGRATVESSYDWRKTYTAWDRVYS